MKIKVVTIDKEDMDEGWLDRTRVEIWLKDKWHFSIDPYINNSWKPWVLFFKGYNEYRQARYFCLNIGWLAGAMFDLDIRDGEEDAADN